MSELGPVDDSDMGGQVPSAQPNRVGTRGHPAASNPFFAGKLVDNYRLRHVSIRNDTDEDCAETWD